MRCLILTFVLLSAVSCDGGLLTGPSSSCDFLPPACEDMAIAMCVDQEICDSVECTTVELDSWCDVIDPDEITIQQCRNIATWVTNNPCEEP
jgi:hypothetical protein